MKKNLLFLMSLFTMTLISSCSQDETIGELDNSLLAQVENVSELNDLSLTQKEMTYEQYLKGYTLEEVSAPKEEDTPTREPETIADAELIQLLNDSLQNTYSKTQIQPRERPYPFMGVFKVNTCGNYPEIQKYMDCEDGGWTNINEKLTESKLPGTWVDSNRNIWMSFCMVMADRYDFIPFRTGALYFVGGNARHIAENGKYLCTDASGNPSGGIEFLERDHDNEDSNNKNTFKLLNTQAYSYNFADVFPEFCPRPTYAGEHNTLLTWIVNKGFPIKQFKPGFSYGVLSLDATDIKINIDDENRKNRNNMEVVQWGYGNGYHRNVDYPKGKYHANAMTENTFYNVKIID